MPNEHARPVRTLTNLTLSFATHTLGMLYLSIFSLDFLFNSSTTQSDVNRLNLQLNNHDNLSAAVNHSTSNTSSTHPSPPLQNHTNSSSFCHTSSTVRTLGLLIGTIGSAPFAFFVHRIVSHRKSQKERSQHLALLLLMIPGGMLNGIVNARASRFFFRDCALSLTVFDQLSIDRAVQVFCTLMTAFNNSHLLLTLGQHKGQDLRYQLGLMSNAELNRHRHRLTCYYSTMKELNNNPLQLPTRHTGVTTDTIIKQQLHRHHSLFLASASFMWILGCTVFYDYAHEATNDLLTPHLAPSSVAHYSSLAGHTAWHLNSLAFSLLLTDTLLVPRRPDLCSYQRPITVASVMLLSIFTSMPYCTIALTVANKPLLTGVVQSTSFVVLSLLFNSFSLLNPINNAYDKLFRPSSPRLSREALTKAHCNENSSPPQVIAVRPRESQP